LEDVKCIGRMGVIGCGISDMFFVPRFHATSEVTSKGEVTFSYIDQMGGCLRQRYKEHVQYITSSNSHPASHSTFSKINMNTDPVNITRSLLHPAHKGWQMTFRKHTFSHFNDAIQSLLNNLTRIVTPLLMCVI